MEKVVFGVKSSNISETVRCKIGTRLLLSTNRKCHTCFRFVPKSTTFDDDLEGSCVLFSKHMCHVVVIYWYSFTFNLLL